MDSHDKVSAIIEVLRKVDLSKITITGLLQEINKTDKLLLGLSSEEKMLVWIAVRETRRQTHGLS